MLSSPAPRASRRRLVAVAALALVCLTPAPAAAAGPPEPVPCLGAASRDPKVPCVNPKLRHAVSPTPEDALLAPNSPCRPETRITTVPYVCSFGAPLGTAPGAPIALVGDSHAAHWRAALEPVAAARGRSGYSLTRVSCPYSFVIAKLDEPRRTDCIRWVRKLPGWFARHPEVSTVFVSARGGVPVEVPKRTSAFQAKVRGYITAWRRLPKSVTSIVVLRDTPSANVRSAACVERAMAAKQRPGIVCAIPRTRSMRADAAVVAASRLKSERVKVIDLTSFLCSPRLCPPVIGGVLVHKDVDHLTAEFAKSLAPYLERRLAELLAGWG